jgi:hypothetical protein
MKNKDNAEALRAPRGAEVCRLVIVRDLTPGRLGRSSAAPVHDGCADYRR